MHKQINNTYIYIYIYNIALIGTNTESKRNEFASSLEGMQTQALKDSSFLEKHYHKENNAKYTQIETVSEDSQILHNPEW